MYRQWIGLEHVGLHPDNEVNKSWKGELILDGIGPFTLKKCSEISSAIVVESPAWFEIQALRSEEGVVRTVTIPADDQGVVSRT